MLNTSFIVYLVSDGLREFQKVRLRGRLGAAFCIYIYESNLIIIIIIIIVIIIRLILLAEPIIIIIIIIIIIRLGAAFVQPAVGSPALRAAGG